ncbi:MAG: sel1 repeat family protein [Gammaproteobacteria bacterium]|nr:sel1 repeat family protein [Gammaproteobacteria bacterium]
MKRLVLILLLAVPAMAARADFNDGVVAYLTGEYDKAYATMRSLADTADHSYAQYYLGMMYLNGQGTEQSYAEAAKWFRKAAEHRVSQAQYKLGLLYTNGQGLPRDFEQAFAWYSVGAAHKHQKSMEAVSGAREQLSPEELKEADKLAAKYVKDYGPKDDVPQDQAKTIDPE